MLLPFVHQHEEKFERTVFVTIDDIKTNCLNKLKAMTQSAFQYCFNDWINRRHKSVVSMVTDLRGIRSILMNKDMFL